MKRSGSGGSTCSLSWTSTANTAALCSARGRTADILPFDSKNKWMAVTSFMGKNAKNGERYVTWIKGGSDVVYNFCTHTIKRGEVVEIDEDERRGFFENNATLASDGLRVFAFAKVAVKT